MSATPIISILNGPNLNMLGTRQPELYGRESLADIEALCRGHAAALGLGVEFRQSNHEGDLVTWIQDCRGRAAGIVINAGAYTHTSVAILDALLAAEVPAVEVHLSNIHQRDSFRHHSYVAKAARGMICGFGSHGYVLALDALARLIKGSSQT
ncbi:type II 3-dehydroquinate dehydratase [Magnetospirillum sp. SS-4]|uniref:type II 3-dehydroquinate dehydratase n=1 Tax=Magnetospirillum sp. SS-4 TaxID=2681465 RepID=UPI00137F0D55|nr:type II 3-dehydroquinate dehydratase [Magnetospirillum sp. SS-4]CAA7627530.1 3-dehydroquinate dehydratase 2 [Magnetospirillum sp. SS-4]